MIISGYEFKLKNKRIFLGDISKDPTTDGDWMISFKRLPNDSEAEKVVQTDFQVSDDALKHLVLLYLEAIADIEIEPSKLVDIEIEEIDDES